MTIPLKPQSMRLYIFLFCLFCLAPAAGTAAADVPHVENGVLDLSRWHPGEDGLLRLDGEWEFYWQHLIPPQSFTAQPAEKPEFFHVPGLWNRYPGNTNPWPGDGYATLRARLVNIPPAIDRIYLHIPEMPTAYRLYANGRLISQNGRVGRSQAEMAPFFAPKIAALKADIPAIELVLQVSNFYHKDGGIWHSLTVGTADQLPQMRQRPVFFDVVFFGGLLVMGIYHLGLFILRTSDRAPLYFGIFCLLIGFRSLLVGQRIFYSLVPGLDWELQQKMEFLLLHLSAPAFFMFFYHLFPGGVSRKMAALVAAVSGILAAIVLVAPPRVFTHTGTALQVLVLAVCAYILFAMIPIIRQKREGSLLFFGGYLVLLAAVINDTLYTHMIIQTRPLAHFGVFLFIFFQAFVLSKKFSLAFKNVEVFSEELKQKNIELLRMDRLKDEFLANTSHELKTPLHGIIGLSESIIGGVHGDVPERQKKDLSIIAASGKRLYNLINDLLDFSRIRRDDMELTLKPVDLNSIVDLVMAFAEPMIGDRQLTVSKNIPGHLPPVMADENRLQQILFNLVGNAVKFTPSGRIEIRAEQHPGRIAVHVSDTGIGISDKDRETIFGAFQQADGAVDRPYGGTGLGLAISRRLVRLHGSDITLESTPGHGSTFSFDLPVSDAPVSESPPDALSPGRFLQDAGTVFATGDMETNDAPETAAITQAPVAGRTILVVDDEPVNLQLAYNQLHPRGFNVLTASDGYEALDMIMADTPDLVLLDIMMPGINGYAVCQKIRESRNIYDLPVIMLTAKNRISDMVRGFESGANDYLPKPFSEEELVARINILLEAKASVERLKENQLLRAEIQRRKEVEKRLKTSQRRLARVLDSSEDAVIAVHQSGLIGFFNQGAERLFGISTNEALHQGPDLLFDPDFVAEFDRIRQSRTAGSPDHPAPRPKRTLKASAIASDGSKMDVTVYVSFFAVEHEQMATLVVRPAPLEKARDSAPASAGHGTGSEEKVYAIEHAVNQIFEVMDEQTNSDLASLRKMDPSLDVVDDSPDAVNSDLSFREGIVKIMTLSLWHWENLTGKTKVDLAEESRLWKAYLDRGTWKTRTLDKYLKMNTLPQKPRWREVFKTAEFVMAQCDIAPEEQKELENLLRRVEHLLAQSSAISA